MAKRKRGEGLSINIIILAVLALVVLIVLIAIFSKQSGNAVKSIESCLARGGHCVPISTGCNPSSEATLTGMDCQKRNNQEQLCCVKLIG